MSSSSSTITPRSGRLLFRAHHSVGTCKFCVGEPATLEAWRSQLLEVQPFVGKGVDDRIIYVVSATGHFASMLPTSGAIEMFVEYVRDNPHLFSEPPVVSFLTPAAIKKLHSPTLSATSTGSRSVDLSEPQELLLPSSYEDAHSTARRSAKRVRSM